jgi:magnesium transporter
MRSRSAILLVATIFMPLVLITGIYGMNFRASPESLWRLGYPGVVVTLWPLIVGVMLVYFRRRGWW